MKKLLLSAAVAFAFGASPAAHAASTISFDMNGADAGGLIAVDNFDWSPGNALAMGVFSTAPVNGAVATTVVAQGALSVFQNIASGTNTNPFAGSEFTFQASFSELAFGIGANSAVFAAGAGPSSFSIYYDPTADANAFTGQGFGAGGDAVLIMHGTLASLSGVFTDTTLLLGDAITLLDDLNGDNANGTLTHQGSGSTTARINVDYANADFFKSSVTSLSVDLQDTSFNAIPFSQTEASDAINGETPFYNLMPDGTRVNAGAANCLGGGQDENGNNFARCDLHLQTDGTTSFNPIPEPGSLALVGLALGALGLKRRRKAA